jgi:hypothetical protein
MVRCEIGRLTQASCPRRCHRTFPCFFGSKNARVLQSGPAKAKPAKAKLKETEEVDACFKSSQVKAEERCGPALCRAAGRCIVWLQTQSFVYLDSTFTGF